jgi:hypothetical protein
MQVKVQGVDRLCYNVTCSPANLKLLAGLFVSFDQCLGGKNMSDDYKTCPFCLEEVPARAIKCRHCESVIEVVETVIVREGSETESGAKDKPRRKPVTQQGIPGVAAYGQPKTKNNLVPVVIILAALLIAALGAGYWLLVRDDGSTAAVEAIDSAVVGAWRGGGEENGIYFQFLPNEMVNIAVEEEDYWFRTQYRIVRTDQANFLEIYHRGLGEWERTAELEMSDDDTLIITDTWDGVVIAMRRITDAEFRDEIADFRFER